MAPFRLFGKARAAGGDGRVIAVHWSHIDRNRVVVIHRNEWSRLSEFFSRVDFTEGTEFHHTREICRYRHQAKNGNESKQYMGRCGRRCEVSATLPAFLKSAQFGTEFPDLLSHKHNSVRGFVRDQSLWKAAGASVNKGSGVGDGKGKAIDLLGKIRTVLAAHFGVDVEYITPATHFWNDLGLDWLDIVELIILVEEQFPNLEIVDRGHIGSVADIIRQIRIVDNKWASPGKVDVRDGLTVTQQSQRV